MYHMYRPSESSTLLDRSGNTHKERRFDLSRNVSQVPLRLAIYMLTEVHT
jgi:hypothetical protein